MPQAVSNSSPLIHLSAIGRLHLLQRFSLVFIPPAVWREVVDEGGNRPGTGEVRRAREEGWLPVVEPGCTCSNRTCTKRRALAPAMEMKEYHERDHRCGSDDGIHKRYIIAEK